jgi:hypothetical protein
MQTQKCIIQGTLLHKCSRNPNRRLQIITKKRITINQIIKKQSHLQRSRNFALDTFCKNVNKVLVTFIFRRNQSLVFQELNLLNREKIQELKIQ